ncbi:MAG: hypothetical protein J0H68_04860 [Sphingobacteriia bacterium]|nr:hypothetical protein [Sphingobacteriia bacterium]
MLSNLFKQATKKVFDSKFIKPSTSVFFERKHPLQANLHVSATAKDKHIDELLNRSIKIDQQKVTTSFNRENSAEYVKRICESIINGKLSPEPETLKTIIRFGTKEHLQHLKNLRRLSFNVSDTSFSLLAYALSFEAYDKAWWLVKNEVKFCEKTWVQLEKIEKIDDFAKSNHFYEFLQEAADQFFELQDKSNLNRLVRVAIRNSNHKLINYICENEYISAQEYQALINARTDLHPKEKYRTKEVQFREIVQAPLTIEEDHRHKSYNPICQVAHLEK